MIPLRPSPYELSLSLLTPPFRLFKGKFFNDPHTTTPLQISSLLPLTTNKNFGRTPPCFHPGLDIGFPSMLDHFHKSGVFINPVFHVGSCAYKIETFAFRKRTKTETATCLLVMIFTKGPGPQSFKSARVFQQPSAFSFPASASVQSLLPW